MEYVVDAREDLERQIYELGILHDRPKLVRGCTRNSNYDFLYIQLRTDLI
jgi:hypothetical protein